MPKEGDLQVWWIPQIPGKPFTVPVASPEEAKKLLRVLADYDLFQLKNNIKPDYANAGGLQVYEPVNDLEGQWTDWYSDAGHDIDNYEPEASS